MPQHQSCFWGKYLYIYRLYIGYIGSFDVGAMAYAFDGGNVCHSFYKTSRLWMRHIALMLVSLLPIAYFNSQPDRRTQKHTNKHNRTYLIRDAVVMPHHSLLYILWCVGPAIFYSRIPCGSDGWKSFCLPKSSVLANSTTHTPPHRSPFPPPPQLTAVIHFRAPLGISTLSSPK